MTTKNIKHKTNYLTYAIDRNGNLVHVDEVPNGNECGCKCPACNESLIAKNKGVYKRHHFAHRSGTECEFAYESMLHRLVKEKIIKAFLNKDKFLIEFEYKSFCFLKNTCKFESYASCYSSTIKRFNLRQFYDSCDQEKAYDSINRRSDLKVFSSFNSRTPPVYIEFCVTHASEKEKLNSGNRIIEIQIEDEEDINSIAEHGFIESTCNNQFDINGQNIPKTVFYGFKKEDYSNTTINNDVEFVHYILYRSGKARCFEDVRNCKNLCKANNSLCEIYFHTPSAFGVYNLAKYIGYKKFSLKNCIVCNNYVESYNGMGRICRLYKYLQIPRDRDFDTSRAKDCNCFTLDKNEMEQELRNENGLEYTICE